MVHVTFAPRVASLLAAAALPAAAMDFCPAVGNVELRLPAGSTNPCDGLRVLAPISAACAAEYPDDRKLQVHAAGILELERKRKIDATVLESLRLTRASPERMQSMKIDPRNLDRGIEMNQVEAAKTDADLAARRSSAAAAGYPQLMQEGTAQKIITNAVWRYLDGGVQQHLAGCTTEAGRQAAREYGAMLGLAGTHGNPLEREIMRGLLESR